MNLKDIASQAIDEAIVEDAVKKQSRKEKSQSDSPVAIEENPDGSTTLSVMISFDPKVRAEKAKAMAKGVKRDDLADDIPEESPELAEDSAPLGIFAAALDEVAEQVFVGAEDASPRRQHGLSPIENCRAKDPLYCPYHGQSAIKDAVDNELKKAGISGYSIEVVPQGKDFMLNVVMSASHGGYSMGNIANAMVSAFSAKGGIKLVQPPNFFNGYANGVRLAQTGRGDIDSVIVSPSSDQLERRVGMLDEWLDDLVTDISDDPTLMQELDPQDLRDLLEVRETLEKAISASTSSPDPAVDAAYKKCREKYHALRAQVDYRDVKTSGDALNEQQAIAKDMQTLNANYHAAKAAVDAAKKALFKNGKFPNGFAKTHPWAEAYNKLSTAIGYFGQKAFDDASTAYANLPASDLKGQRAALSAMAYAAEMYKAGLDNYLKELPKFMQDFEDWAMNDPSIQPAQFKAAFPNSSSAQSTT